MSFTTTVTLLIKEKLLFGNQGTATQEIKIELRRLRWD